MRCWSAKARELTVATLVGRRNREDDMQIARAAVLATASLALLGPNAHAQTAAWHPVGNVEFFVGAGASGENYRIARAIQRVLTKENLVDSMMVLSR
jgi:tripartite-type tricarboxylate transporter receptor subunit TctC